MQVHYVLMTANSAEHATSRAPWNVDFDDLVLKSARTSIEVLATTMVIRAKTDAFTSTAVFAFASA